MQGTLSIARKLQNIRGIEGPPRKRNSFPCDLALARGLERSRSITGSVQAFHVSMATLGLIKERLTLDDPNGVQQCRSSTKREFLGPLQCGLSNRAGSGMIDQKKLIRFCQTVRAVSSGVLRADRRGEFCQAGDCHIGFTVGRSDGTDAWACRRAVYPHRSEAKGLRWNDVVIDALTYMQDTVSRCVDAA